MMELTLEVKYSVAIKRKKPWPHCPGHSLTGLGDVRFRCVSNRVYIDSIVKELGHD